MVLFMWQDDMMGVVRFTDKCLEWILYTSDQAGHGCKSCTGSLYATCKRSLWRSSGSVEGSLPLKSCARQDKLSGDNSAEHSCQDLPYHSS